MQLNQIQGQPYAVRFLLRSIANRRTAHAYLFTGPEGVGKRTTALSLAQALNCLAPVEHDACGRCAACRKIDSSVHPDVHGIFPDGNSIKIEQIRENIQREALLKPLEGRTKIYIIDPADAMTTEAANSLLKLLEEPPENVVMILITSQPFGLLETIRSRCQEVRFHALKKEILGVWLESKLAIAPQEAATLAMLSGGRPAEALRLADPELQGLRKTVLEWIGGSQSGQWPDVAGKMTEYRELLPEIFTFLLTWYRDVLVFLKKGGRDVIINRDRMQFLETAAAEETPASVAEKCRVVMQAIEQLKRNVNLQLLLENLLIRLERPLQEF